MMLLRMLAAATKPALLTGALAATATGGWFLFDNTQRDAPTAFERLQDGGQRLVLTEFGADADTIVAVDPADPAGTRAVIATVDHAPEYGIFAVLAPDGGALAYTALPVDAPRPAPDAPAIAGIVDAGGAVTVLATDVDLVVPPVWSPDGAAIAVRKNLGCEDAGLDCAAYPAGSFEILLLGRDGARTTLTAWRSAAAFPIGFSPDGGAFFFATLGATGTDLYRVGRDGSGEMLVAHLSDGVARDWRLSPDGTQLAFSAAEGGAQPTIVARVVDVATGAIADALGGDALVAGPPSTGVARGEFNPAWEPDGGLTVAALNLDGGSSAVTVQGGGSAALTVADARMDLPLAWSPDGTALAVRAVEGATPFEAGASRIELIDEGGGRVLVADGADVTIAGWAP